LISARQERTTTVHRVNTRILMWTSAASFVLILTACGGGGSYGGGGATPSLTKSTIGGTVSGLQGSLVLRNNGEGDLTVTADGPFTFATAIDNGRPYLVTIQTQPAAQECVIVNGSGTVAGANVVSVAVTCGALLTTQLRVEANVNSANLSWRSPSNAAFDVYVSSAPHCDIQNYSACPDGALLANVSSPLTIEQLRNGQTYFFQVDATLRDGTHQLSNEAGARPNSVAFNNSTRAIAFGEDGTQYVGGNFTAVGIASGGAVPFDAAGGQPAIADFPIVTGIVLAAVSDDAGGWYVGGRFTHVGGQAHENLAHILANGAVDPNFTLNFGSREIDALAFSGGTLYAGGGFKSIDGQQRDGLAAFGTDGTLRDWNPGVDGVVQALAIAGDVVYAGGNFTSVGPQGNSVPRNRLAAIGVDGTPLAWDPNVTGSSVFALEVSGHTVYAGGLFSSVDGTTRHNLAAISTTGELLEWNPDADFTVLALAAAGNTVYAGGAFGKVAGQARNGLAAVDATGAGRLLDWHPDVGNGLVFALKVEGSTIYAGGTFGSIDGIKRSNLAAIGTDGQVSTWSPAPNDSVQALAIAGDTVFAGGRFTGIASATRHFLAAIDPHGRLTAWNPDVNSSVGALAVAGNTVYAGGSFNQVAGETRNRLAAISADGALLDWNPGADNEVLALAVFDNKVYAGGRFTQVTTTAQGARLRGHVAAIRTDGTLLDWSPDVNDTVNTLLVAGGTVYVGGTFTQVTTAEGAQPRNRLAAIGTDGKLSDTWNPDASAQVRALAIMDDTLYAAGDFATISGQARGFLAAIGTDGALSSWRADANGSVRALAVAGNTIYASGSFSNIFARNGLKPRHGLAAIDANGDLLEWSPDGASVEVMEVSGNTVYVGGLFNTLTGLPRFFFGAIDASGIGEVIL
jgi:trimeric autotransporter adhesin